MSWIVDSYLHVYSVVTGNVGGEKSGAFYVDTGNALGMTISSGSIVGGFTNGDPVILEAEGLIDGDHIASAGASSRDASSFVGLANVSVAYAGHGSTTTVLSPFWYASAALWGTGHTSLFNGAVLAIGSSDTFATQLILTGGSFLDGASTGTSYAAGVWTDGVALTAANMDADNGLQNPRTGSKYSKN